MKASLQQLEERLRTLVEGLTEKVRTAQRGVPTFFDNFALSMWKMARELAGEQDWRARLAQRQSPATLSQIEEGLERLGELTERQQQGRLVSWGDRRAYHARRGGEREIGTIDFLMSQGVMECMQWKGRPIFKTVFDLGIYSMMTWELRPPTIIEIGSGNGSSAVWFADLLQMYQIDGHVYSIDIARPDLSHERVTFIEGDAHRIEEVSERASLASLPHPWLIIEDAHVNVHGVMRHFHDHLAAGDYLVIEDSGIKGDEIARFLDEHPASYLVDTRYTDYFGRNATCALDSIFRKMPR